MLGDGNTSTGTAGGTTAGGTTPAGNTTDGGQGNGSGNQTDPAASAPVDGSGNQVTVLGDGNTTARDETTRVATPGVTTRSSPVTSRPTRAATRSDAAARGHRRHERFGDGRVHDPHRLGRAGRAGSAGRGAAAPDRCCQRAARNGPDRYRHPPSRPGARARGAPAHRRPWEGSRGQGGRLSWSAASRSGATSPSFLDGWQGPGQGGGWKDERPPERGSLISLRGGVGDRRPVPACCRAPLLRSGSSSPGARRPFPGGEIDAAGPPVRRPPGRRAAPRHLAAGQRPSRAGCLRVRRLPGGGGVHGLAGAAPRAGARRRRLAVQLALLDGRQPRPDRRDDEPPVRDDHATRSSATSSGCSTTRGAASTPSGSIPTSSSWRCASCRATGRGRSGTHPCATASVRPSGGRWDRTCAGSMRCGWSSGSSTSSGGRCGPTPRAVACCSSATCRSSSRPTVPTSGPRGSCSCSTTRGARRR